MSPLAKLLQIKPSLEIPSADRPSTLQKLWKRFVEMLRSAKVQRRIRRVEVVERVTLGNKQSVVLLRVDQREFVVGCCGESVVLLVAPPAEPVKERQHKRRANMKLKAAQAPAIPAILPTVEPATSVVATPKPRRHGKVKTSVQNGLLVKKHAPTKARLVKAFAGRSR